MIEPIRQLLNDIFGDDFSGFTDDARFHSAFFSKTLSLADLKKLNAFVTGQPIALGGKTISAALQLPGKGKEAPFVILAQLHGNEAAGLAGIALAMALYSAGKLEQSVIGMIGNSLAATQYFAAWEKDPAARQETRDAFRCGLAPDGTLLPDLNRIPVDFLTNTSTDFHTLRAQELYTVGEHASGIADLHTARGTMVCITDFKHEEDMKNSPIRAVLTELAEAISANASTTVTVQTLKTILSPLRNIKSQMGIEAGRHEMKEAPEIAASYTLSLLHKLGITKVAPYFKEENNQFERYSVRPRITYADLEHADTLKPGDQIYMAASAKAGDKALITVAGVAYKEHQYDEMEGVKKHDVVAVAVPSGTLFKAPYDFSGIFWSKAAALYDKDPAVGPWPVSLEKINSVKFCYPCIVSGWKMDF